MCYLCAVWWCTILRPSEGSVYDSSYRSLERHWRFSLCHHRHLSQETGLQPWVTHWATVFSIKYPLCWCQRSRVLHPKRRRVFMIVIFSSWKQRKSIWSSLRVRLPHGLEYHDKCLSGWCAEGEPCLSWISPVRCEVVISPAHTQCHLLTETALCILSWGVYHTASSGSQWLLLKPVHPEWLKDRWVSE